MAIENGYYSHDHHGDYELISVGELQLEEGGTIPDCRLAVATFGTLNEARDNAILIPTWFSGTHQVWRDVYIGTDHALNPDKYFIICVDQIGSGLSTSPHNADGPNASIAMSKFPDIRIGDNVVAQERLLREHFGIDKLALVVGGSMGAQQTYEWAVRFPDKVLRAAPIAGTAQNTPDDYLIAEVIREQIMSDPAWKGGEYSSNDEVVDGLTRMSHIWAIKGFSTEFWKQEVWRALDFESKEAFLAGFLEPYFTAMDPNDLLTQAWAWQRGDVARHTGGDLAAALSRITAKVFVLPIDLDQLFPPADCEAEARLIPNAEFRIVNDVLGHLGLFGVAPTYMVQIDRHLQELLDAEV
ncbi:alpha/beta fold hydrolase [Gordonia sp. (in: high G+C Gram-positive bacteria)]|jgi:homoserine O-acetyltransferase|uniref:alpha/beta fold hydrolase n=1 Tax=Gordonia sp. (in: high G+C Gram-positive bacteria) TaxID=84139 RepID=UPI001E0675F2|nr:alpha/beta fold hydrolase [Gordonia sp. (in: high G+C Gram-positive bacteria)]MCB1294630.1 alpha/beta fold hydrolase [Gordonia sp. (in: high G+C Gram-positive bacteria)]HMS76289.1 alpha/beta fold hydrolase [Gordonia sp. (in: high G+C Gram-positive bacteria)]HQV18389.1 alpha/beta fold hydrolase [Gordonia sp. (in: high G+C Gram-positive bacteria)]